MLQSAVRGIFPILLCALFNMHCGIPHDPEGTTERVRDGVMLVGVVENGPWVQRRNGEPAGIEPGLVRRFAHAFRSEVHWKWGGLEEHMKAVSRHQLDLVIAGLDSRSPWKEQVAFTTPYYTTRIPVGVHAGTNIGDIDGVPIYVEEGTATGAYVQDAGAVPRPVADPSGTEGPVAAPVWELRAWGFDTTDHVLNEVEHVWALPPGENRWLSELENFLHNRRHEIPDLVIREGVRALAKAPENRPAPTGTDIEQNGANR